MTALVRSRQSSHERWTHHLFPLTATTKAFKNGRAVIDLSTGKVRPAAAGQGLLHIGKFDEDIDASSVEKPVNVNLEIEIEVEWLENDTASPVLLTQRGQLCYLLDDQTVTSAAAGLAVAGRVWDVDSVKGVAVQKLAQVFGGASNGTSPAYASGDLIIPAGQPSDQVFDVPTTTGASTVTLPAAAKDGTRLYFVADGVKNAHTVQYRDAAGAVNLTTALTASKRHLVIAVSLNGKWSANAYVSP
jgi:hypothetical protein